MRIGSSEPSLGAILGGNRDGACFRKETKMHGNRLLFASPLIAALVFGTGDISQASVVPETAGAGDSHITTTSKVVAPPVCRRQFRGELMQMCANGWSEGFAAGQATCDTRQRRRAALAPALEDAVYVTGYEAGLAAGKASC
jgi:hypothetical protein